MVTKQIYQTRRFYNNKRHDAPAKVRVDSKINIKNNIKMRPIFIKNRMCNIDGINKNGTL